MGFQRISELCKWVVGIQSREFRQSSITMNEAQPVANVPAGGVLEPISLKDFFAEYWEQKPLHITRPKNNPFAALISIDTIEELISTNKINFPTVQLSHAGQSIPVSTYTDEDNVVVPSRVIEQYKSGSTIVISHAHRLVPNLMCLCRSIQSSLMMRCQTNVYLSPAGNQGFNPHYDTHDVFIIQVSGKKTFNFYSSGANFPTSADRFNRDIHKVGAKTEEIVLGAGDTLYIPRGVAHDAVADTKEPSLHVTLGVYPVLLSTLINEVTQLAVESDARLRRALPQQEWTMEQGVETTTRLLHEVLQAHVTDKVVSAAFERLRDDFALDSVQNSGGLLCGAQQIDLQPDTHVVMNLSDVLQVERTESVVKLRLFGQVAEFSEPLGSAVEWLMRQNSVKVRDIPMLEPSQQFALIQQLLTLNVVRV